MGKNSLNNFISHLSWLEKLSPAHTHSLKTFREFLKPYELLFSELESLVKCNHKIRVQECYGGRAMSCPWHGGGWRHMGAPFGRHAALQLFHLKSVLFSSQCVYLISNINIYFLLIRSGGRYSDTHYFLCHGLLLESVLETGTIFKCHWKALQNIRICESYKSINILYLKAEFNYV